MPVQIDHTRRRSQLAEAVWRVVIRDGVPGASVRGVAREAQLSMGSVRHFFATQDELLQFAMREVIVRATRRIRSLADDQDALGTAGRPVESIARILEQVLPLDEQRLAEARIWVAFSVHGAHHPSMAAIRRQADDDVRALCHTSLASLAERGHLHAAADLALEADRLWALLDGLTMHIVFDDQHVSAGRAAAVLRAHLDSLAVSEPGGP